MEICCQMQHSADAAMKMQPLLSYFNLRGRKIRERRRNIDDVKPHSFNYNQFDISNISVTPKDITVKCTSYWIKIMKTSSNASM